MKKYIFAVTAILCCAICSITASNFQVTPNSNYTVASQSRSVKLQKIIVQGSVVMKSTCSGTFDEENMTVSFHNTTEKVKRNTDTGYGRENYTYKAGTNYYFN